MQSREIFRFLAPDSKPVFLKMSLVYFALTLFDQIEAKNAVPRFGIKKMGEKRFRQIFTQFFTLSALIKCYGYQREECQGKGVDLGNGRNLRWYRILDETISVSRFKN